MGKKSFTGIFLFLLLLPLSVFGQDSMVTPSSEVPSSDSQLITVATVNIDRIEATAQDDRTFNISMTVSNAEGAQPQIGYFLRLIQTNEDGSQVVADTHTYNDTFSLAEHSRMDKSFSYTVPEYVGGTYDLWIFLENKNGLSFSLAPVLQNIVLQAKSQTVDLNPSKCSLTVEDVKTGNPIVLDSHPNPYSILEGVDFDPKEEYLVLTCVLSNSFEAEKTVFPRISIHKRGLLGDVILEKELTDHMFLLPSKGERMVRVLIPTPEVPQAYQANLIFIDRESGKVTSPPVDLHFVVQGESGTIQNVVLDKDAYKKGDTALVTFFWSPSADGFYLSRGGLGTKISGSPTVEIMMLDGMGKMCSDSLQHTLDSALTSQQAISVTVLEDCVDPSVTVRLKNGEGKTLDEQIMSVVTTRSDPVKTDDLSNSTFTSLRIVFLLTVVCIVLVIFFLYVRFRRDGSDVRTGPGSMGVFIFFFLLSGFFLVGALDAEAYTKTFSLGAGLDTIYSGNVSLSGGVVTVTGNANASVCANMWSNSMLSAAHATGCTLTNNTPCSFKTLISQVHEAETNHSAISLVYTGTSQTFTKSSSSNAVKMWASISMVDKMYWFQPSWITDQALIDAGWVKNSCYEKGVLVPCRWVISRGEYFMVSIPAPPSYSCTNIPTNATLCSGDSTGLSANTASTVVTTCGLPKCEYTCNSGYTKSGSSCVAVSPPPSYSCTNIPTNANLCSGDSTDLSANTASTVVTTCGLPKCEYTCNSGYTKSGNTCVVASSPSGELTGVGCTIPVGLSTCSVNISWMVQNVSGGSLMKGSDLIEGDISGDGNKIGIPDIGSAWVEFKLFSGPNGTGTYLDNHLVSGNCASGVWESGVCADVPTPSPTNNRGFREVTP